MKEKSLLLGLLGEQPLFKVIDFLIDNLSVDFTKKQIAEGAGIARASLFNHWDEIEKYGLVKVTRRFGKTKLYTLNTKNQIVKRLLDLEKALIAVSLEKESAKKSVKQKEKESSLVLEEAEA